MSARTFDNELIELNRSIEFDWVRQSNKIELKLFVSSIIEQNWTQKGSIVFEKVRLSSILYDNSRYCSITNKILYCNTLLLSLVEFCRLVAVNISKYCHQGLCSWQVNLQEDKVLRALHYLDWAFSEFLVPAAYKSISFSDIHYSIADVS